MRVSQRNTDDAKRADIQGMRALAVLSVVLYHANVPPFAGGYVGVDIFFVISGYLITRNLVLECDRSSTINLLRFYAGRVRRLLPAAILILLATALATRWILSPVEQRELSKAVLFAAAYVVNNYFALEATDYLAGDVHQNPVLHMWSLSVEEQFYLVWPFLIIACVKLGSSRASLRKRILIGAIGIALLSFLASLWMFRIARPWAFFGSPFRAWEFAVGAIVFLVFQRDYFCSKGDAWRNAVGLLGLLLVGFAVCLYDDKTPFPAWAALMPVLGAAMLIVAGTGGDASSLRFLNTRIAQGIGAVSYSWYLWHWPVLVLPSALGELDALERGQLMLLSLVLAVLTYWTVENPVRYWSRLQSARYCFGLGGFCTAVGLIGGLALYWAAKAAEEADFQKAIAIVRHKRPVPYQDGCHADVKRDKPEAPCAYGQVDSGRTIMLLGDSHAVQWFPALERMASEKGVRLISLTKSGCPMADIAPYLGSHGRVYDECISWRKHVIERVERERPLKIVIAHSYRYVGSAPTQISENEWRRGLSRTVGLFAPLVQNIYLVRDTPWPGFDVPTCLSRAFWRLQDASACVFDRASAVNEKVAKVDRWVAKQFVNVETVDLNPWFCDRPQCEVMIDGRIVYNDSHHVSVEYSAALADVLADILTSDMRKPSPSPPW